MSKDLYEIYPVSLSQKGIFLKSSEKTNEYNIILKSQIKGKLDINRFVDAFKKMVNRHDVFKTEFIMVNDEPKQRVYMESKLELELYSIFNSEDYLPIINNLNKPFDISKGPLARAALLKIKENEYAFGMVIHHIICDGTSWEIIIKDIKNFYIGNDPKPLARQYKDYALENYLMIEEGKFDKYKNYWSNAFKEDMSHLNFPDDFYELNFQNKAEAAGTSIVIKPEITNELIHMIRKYMRIYRFTLNTILFGLYSVLLYKYTNQTDIIIGTISTGRNREGTSDLVGTFINVLPVIINIDSNKSLAEHINDVTETMVKVYRAQEYPFEEIIKEVKNFQASTNGFNPIIDTMLVYNGSEETEAFDLDDSIRMTVYNHGINKVTFGIHTDIFKTYDNHLIINMGYDSSKYKKEKMEMLCKHYKKLLTNFVNDPEQLIKYIDILYDEEKSQILESLTGKAVDCKQFSILNLIEQNIYKNGEKIAIKYSNDKITYHELGIYINNIAFNILKVLKNGKIRAAVSITRNKMLVPSIIAIIKAGGAYIPIDNKWPLERKYSIIANSNISLVIDTGDDPLADIDASIPRLRVQDILLDEELQVSEISNPNRPLYIIYTSGSTGVPKGVEVRLDSFTNLMIWYIDEFSFNENENNLSIAPLSFDLSQKNIYAPLMVGGTLVLYPDMHINYSTMTQIVRNEKISTINCAPAVIYPLIEINKENMMNLITLINIILGGENIDATKFDELLKVNKKLKIANTYGPTECTDIATYHIIDSKNEDLKKSIPIGKPINNCSLIIADKDLNLVPFGVEGEILISGYGLSNGYINDHQMNFDKFIEKEECGNINKYYRTGDFGKLLTNGEILYIGRNDFQVKINGLRIEIGEIDNAVKNIKAIDQFIVTAVKHQENEKALCLYYTVKENKKLDTHEIKNILEDMLPLYMVPTFFMRLDEMPLNSHGKIDREMLPLIGLEKEGPKAEEKENLSKIGEKLISIWKEILKNSNLRTTDNLLELGANSLKIIIAISDIQEEFEVKIPISEVFRTPYIYSLEKYIIKNLKSEDSLEIDGELEFKF